ncbi:MAG: DMT family transporter [Spirochaetaceae bacterium]|jgi:drug/metabolite transporter (DMT)-like permease|nr:DMT family transporter [Spirochaetaceae bacterium]
MKQNRLSPVNYRPSSQAGQGAVLLCALFWSTSGLFIKLIDWHPLVIAGLRSFVAALFMLAIRLLFPRRGKGKNKAFPLIAGGLAYALTMICFVIANKLTASANAILLEYSAPVWAALLGWFLIKEKPHWEHWLALALVMGGLYLFFKDGLAGGSLLGDGIAVLSGIFFGANSVFMRMQKEGNPSDTMLLAHIITALICLPFLFISPPVFTAQSICSILFMGIVQIGCASLLFAYGIKRVPAVQAMLTAMAEPILNPLWVLLVTGEKPSLSALTGGGIIVAAVLVSTLVGKKREQREAG